jgi:hypothetical protein
MLSGVVLRARVVGYFLIFGPTHRRLFSPWRRCIIEGFILCISPSASTAESWATWRNPSSLGLA